jgi:hypothetical protein
MPSPFFNTTPTLKTATG